MKNKVLVFGICMLMLLVIFSSGCIDFGGEEEKNEKPIADAGADQTVYVNNTVYLNGTAVDPDGTIVKYEWDFNNDNVYDWESNVTGSATTTYNTPAEYIAVLTVTDNDGATGTDFARIIVQEVPIITPVIALSTPHKTSDNVNNTIIASCSIGGIDYRNVSWYLLDNAGLTKAYGTFSTPITSAPTAGVSTTPDVDWVDNDDDNRLSTGDVIFINENSWDKNIVAGWVFKLHYIPTGATMAEVTYT
ncbi:MAG: PKD domain-containing protein [Thermoplasmatales archaeon]|nr:PKD domain-containing protein [Thermoplasmatales archaeon]